MIRKASAVWNGSLKEGKGTISTESGVLSNAQYSFSTRFENGRGTNPEELIAAAHAGCFTMALSAQLGNAGITPESLETTASVTLEKLEAGFTVTKVHLDVEARIPGADPAAFQKAAEAAEKGCPISRLLKAEITHHREPRVRTSQERISVRVANLPRRHRTDFGHARVAARRGRGGAARFGSHPARWRRRHTGNYRCAEGCRSGRRCPRER